MKLADKASLISIVIMLWLNIAWADSITKEKAIDMALASHPGSVEKAYQETKKGVEVWEVMINGEDGNIWKVYFRVDNGELFMKKLNNEVVN
jgi:uncharacterized membrane protein YkoI